MKVFVDNDVAVKLAQWGMLSRFVQHLTKKGGAEVFTVPTLRYRFKLDEPTKAASLLGSTQAVVQLKDFVAACKPAKLYSQNVAAALTDVPGIDAGEAVLLAAAAYFDTALVDTGDKNALRALGKLGPGHLVTTALAERIACLEQTLHYLVGRWSFEQVNSAVRSAPQADKAALHCFNTNCCPSALAALAAKVDELRPNCGGTLAMEPFAWID